MTGHSIFTQFALIFELVGWALIAACVVLALLPPKYDPAIRLKEWADDDKNRE